MKGYRIASYLSQFPNVYSSLQSLVSIDEIPEISRTSFVVVNVSKSSEEGTVFEK